MHAGPALIKPRIFIDADVLLSGSASPYENSASLVLLRMGEITLIEALTSDQVITEVTRNLAEKMPNGLAAFSFLVRKSLQVVPDPAIAELEPFWGKADPKDLPILVAALRENCSFLATFNVRHFKPDYGSLTVLKPGDLVVRIRYLLSHLGGKWQ